MISGELMESDEITADDKAAMLWRNAETFYKLPLVRQIGNGNDERYAGNFVELGGPRSWLHVALR